MAVLMEAADFQMSLTNERDVTSGRLPMRSATKHCS
jgi:hypothetical protein